MSQVIESKRIVVIYSPGLGGAWLIRLVEAAQESRHNFVHVLVGSPSSDLLDALERLQARVEKVDYERAIHAPRVLRAIREIFRRTSASTVHTHGHEATAIGLLAARLTGVEERIYTRHHSTSNREGGPFYAKYYDYLANRLATRIIATSAVVKDCLVGLEGVDEIKIRMQSYRFDLERFRKVDELRVRRVRESYELPDDAYVVGMVSRLVWLKGVEYGVQAFRRFRERVPHAVLLLAGAVGPSMPVVKRELDTLPPDSYRVIPFEKDMPALYKAFDIVMHLPVSRGVEAWGQVYVEALAAGLPLICTESGVACESLMDGRDCLMVPYRDSTATGDALFELFSNDLLRERLIDGGWQSIQGYGFADDDCLIEEQYGN